MAIPWVFDGILLQHFATNIANYTDFHLATMTQLTHWPEGRIYVSAILAIVGSDNALSPGRRQAIILTNAGIVTSVKY